MKHLPDYYLVLGTLVPHTSSTLHPRSLPWTLLASVLAALFPTPTNLFLVDLSRLPLFNSSLN